MLVESAAHGTCFLGPQIQGLVLLALIEFPEVLFLSLVSDGQYTGDGFTNHSDLGEFGSRDRLESLEAAPPVTLATHS